MIVHRFRLEILPQGNVTSVRCAFGRLNAPTGMLLLLLDREVCRKIIVPIQIAVIIGGEKRRESM